MNDYSSAVQALTRASICCAIIGFVISVIVECARHRKGGNSHPMIEEVTKKLDMHVIKASASAAIPMGCALVYSAFDDGIVRHLASMHAPIAVSGLTLLLTSARTLFR